MMNLLKYIDSRLAEPSTWSALAALLLALHINVDPGLMKAITIWGTGFAGILGFLIAENSSGKAGTQVAQDILNALVAITNKQGPKA
jgi:hypothetical protein